VGHLALHHGIDILPVYLGGTFQALPKGVTVLRRRDVTARIGPPLEVSELRRLTADLSRSEASRAAGVLARRAVLALSRGEVLDIREIESLDAVPPAAELEGMAPLFEELGRRFSPAAVEEPLSFYFSLGEKERWTLKVDRERCEVLAGKAVTSADCVLKTSPGMFVRIVREAYTPEPSEFVSGVIKSNNIGLLLTFQKIFQLDRPSVAFEREARVLSKELEG
jgi:long-chain acyl-CoA synthetase